MIPKISIIVPVYNVEKYISKCIDSILSQTFTNFELLLIDDGSSDNSGNICDEYLRKDNRIRVFHKINGGVSSARNLALDYAIGDFVMFVDSDDWITIDCLELCIKEIHEKELDALQFGFVMVWDDRKSYRIKNETCILSGEQYIQTNSFNVCVCGGVYKRNIIEEYNLRFLPQLKLAEDQIFILSIIRYVQRIKYIEKSLYYYLQREDSAVHSFKSKDMLLSCEELIKLSKCWPIIKEHVDYMILNFILDMINNNNVSYNLLEKIYKRQDVKKNTDFHGLSYLFFKLSKINFKMACIFTFIYLKIRFKLSREINFLI